MQVPIVGKDVLTKGGAMKHKIPDEVLKAIFQRRLQRRNINGEVYQKIKKMILSGKLEKGHRLVQEQLALSFNVSRQTIRTALVQLKKERLIVWKYRGGSYVN
jgi:DNA-binding GntR family transcriptional regulator